MHLDGHLEGADCLTTDSVLCDRCKELLAQGSSSGSPKKGSSPKKGIKSNMDSIYYTL